MTVKKKLWSWGEKPPEEQIHKPKHGRCLKCDSGRFSLKVSKGQMKRTCRGCGEVVEV
jgi:hypothetical protein